MHVSLEFCHLTNTTWGGTQAHSFKIIYKAARALHPKEYIIIISIWYMNTALNYTC